MTNVRPIYVAVTHTANSDARTGVQTVVRGLVHGLGSSPENTELVWWMKRSRTLDLLDATARARFGLALPITSPERTPELKQRPPTAERPKKILGWLYRSQVWKRTVHWKRYRTARHLKAPLHLHPVHRPQARGAWLILPEVMYGPETPRVIAYAKKCGMLVAAIFHDAIPVSHPELVRQEAAAQHAEYMRILCGADLILPVSEQSGEDFRRFAQDRMLTAPRIKTCGLAAEMLDQARAQAKIEGSTVAVNALCVCTLEPRKNHVTLIEAFAQASEKIPGLQLHLVGDRYKDADHLVEAVQEAKLRNPNLIWHGRLSPNDLRALYVACEFTVYPSFIEGFGLPVMESLWHRRPCICADSGSMAENAAGGGCLTTDVRDPVALGEAIVRLASDSTLRFSLTKEIEQRRLKTWREYGNEIRSALASPT